MAKPNIFSALGNARTRTFVFFLGGLLLIGVVVAFMQSGDDAVEEEMPSTVTAAPSQLRAIPGGEVPKRYQELQREENIRRAEEAEKKRGSAIPTIIGAAAESDLEKSLFGTTTDQAGQTADNPFGDLTRGGFEGAGLFNPQAAQAEEEDARERRLREQRERLEQLRLEKERQRELERLRLLAEQEKQAFATSVQQTAQAMSAQVDSLSQSWRKVPEQVYIQGSLPFTTEDDKKAKALQVTGIPGTEDETDTKVLTTPDGRPIKRTYIKAGSVMFGVLDTAILSDEPGPVLATIVHGKFKGAKLIGSFEHQKPYGETVALRFNTITLPAHEKSMAVDIVAIDPDTARTALSSDVNHHYLLRYGTLFAASFVEGYGKAVSQQGTTTTSPNGTTQETKPELSGKDQFLSALGTVGEKWSKQVEPIFKTPYTVEVNQGLGVGLLFLSDIDVTKKEG